MLTKCLAVESSALELKCSPMVLRGLGALQSWSLRISSADLPGFNPVAAAQGVWADELAGFPRWILHRRYVWIQNSLYRCLHARELRINSNVSRGLILGDLGQKYTCLELVLRRGSSRSSLAWSTAFGFVWRNALGFH